MFSPLLGEKRGCLNCHDEWEVPEENDIYPKVLKGHMEIEEGHHIPEVVGKIYAEVLKAITEDARILAGLGLRGIVEAVCNDLEITGRSLETRINKLVSAGYISKSDAERLHAIRFMGNDAAHEIRSPNDRSLRVALKIVEHLLQSVYILEKEAGMRSGGGTQHRANAAPAHVTNRGMIQLSLTAVSGIRQQ